jgi:hypothetical protein
MTNPDPTVPPEQREYDRARTRVEEKLGFVMHLVCYVVVNTFLVALNLATSPGYFWVKWALLGWGIGLVLHGVGVFVVGGNSRLKEWLIERELDRNR